MFRKLTALFLLFYLFTTILAQESNVSYEQFKSNNRTYLTKAKNSFIASATNSQYLDSIRYEHPSLDDSTFRKTINKSIDLIYEYLEDSSILTYLQQYKQYAQNRRDSLLLASIEDYITEVYINQTEFDKAIESAKRALKIYESKEDLTNQGKVILKIAAIQYSQGDYISSIETVFKAADNFKKSGSSKHLAFSYLQIGTTYLFIHQFELAKENLNLAKEQFMIQGDTLGASMSLANIALVHFEQEEYAEALSKFKEASKEIIKSKRNIAIAQIYQNLGVSFFGLNELDSAQLYLNKALEINLMIGYELGISTVYLDYARLMKKSGNIDSTIALAKKALNLIEKTDDLESQYNLYGLLGEALYQIDEKEEAAEYMYKHILLSDSVEKENKHIEDIAYQQDAKIKSYKEQLLIEKQKQELFAKENSYQKNLIFILTFIGILMIALILVVSFINKRNSRLNKVLSENQMTIQNDLEIKNALLKEIHHRVKNNLQVISSMLSIQGQYLEDEKFQEVISECKNRISSMALIHESLYKKDPNDITSIASYFNKLIPQLVSTYQIDQNRVKLNLDINDVELSIDESVPCGLLINEIVSNALKHAFPGNKEGQIDISLRQNDQKYLLTIKDNGIGLPKGVEPENQDSFGFLLIYTLINQLDGQLNLIRNNGLAFHISWKVNENLSVSDAHKA